MTSDDCLSASAPKARNERRFALVRTEEVLGGWRSATAAGTDERWQRHRHVVAYDDDASGLRSRCSQCASLRRRERVRLRRRMRRLFRAATGTAIVVGARAIGAKLWQVDAVAEVAVDRDRCSFRTMPRVRRCVADQQAGCEEQTDRAEHARQDARHARLYHIIASLAIVGRMLRRVSRSCISNPLSTPAGPAWPGSLRVSRRRACHR